MMNHYEQKQAERKARYEAQAKQARTLLDLLAYLVAASVQGIQHQEDSGSKELDTLAAITGVDPSQWWEPSAESYL